MPLFSHGEGAHFLTQVKLWADSTGAETKQELLTCVKSPMTGLRHDNRVTAGKRMDSDKSNLAGPESKLAPTKPATVVYACSGCSDAGELADHIARQLTREWAAQMSCLAGIGGRVKSLVMKAENAERILVVDGCPLNCAAHTLRLAGLQNFDHLELHKIGIRKGSCPVTEEKVATGVQAAKKILSGVGENHQS